MTRVVASSLPDEVVAAMMEDPDRAARAAKIADQLIAEVEYHLRFGVEPTPLARTVLPSVLRWLETRERAERDIEAAEHFEAMREFVQAFRRPDVQTDHADVAPTDS